MVALALLVVLALASCARPAMDTPPAPEPSAQPGVLLPGEVNP